MARFNQITMPTGAKVGDSWEHPSFGYRRVFSKGHSWENVTGGTHPDEVKHEEDANEQQIAGAKAGGLGAEVPTGTGESASGDGNNGEAVSESSGQGEVTGSVAPADPGIDANGSDVV